MSQSYDEEYLELISLKDEQGSLDRLIREEEIQRVKTAFNALDEIYRRVVVLRINYDMSHEEIGSRLGIPAATSRSRLRFALAKLREELGPYI